MSALNGHLPDRERITRLEQAVERLERVFELLSNRIVHLEVCEGQGWVAFPPCWGLTMLEASVLRALADAERLRGAEIINILYVGRPPEERPSAKVIHVVMNHLRTKLRRQGLGVEMQNTGPNRGYFLRDDHKELVRQAILERPQ
jgi:hypothetical protein